MQKLCLEANKPYANVTLDLGGAMNAYKVIWNCQNKFANAVIHLGDFHFMKEGFNCIGKLTKGSGFEDIVFQSVRYVYVRLYEQCHFRIPLHSLLEST